MMGDLIRRSALIESLSQKKSIMVAEPDVKHSVSLETVIDYIGEYPTVDAVPVVHGEWIEHKWAEEVSGWLISNFECSQCHMWKRYNTNFCPECGADMRKKVQE